MDLELGFLDAVLLVSLTAASAIVGRVLELRWAERLHISMATVKTHVNHIFTKTRVRDRAQAVAYAYDQGLVVAPPSG